MSATELTISPETVETSLVERRFDPWWLAPLFAVMAGVAQVWFATTLGLNVSGDSVTYLEVARNIIAGQGVHLIQPGGAKVPLIVFPPGYPLMLAAGGIAGVDPLVSGRYLNCVALIAMLVTVAMMIRGATRSTFDVSIALLLLLTSRPLIAGYTRLLSEAPFVALAMIALAMLVMYVRETSERKRWWLVGAGMFIAAASLTRYAGVALVIVAIAGVLLHHECPWRRRIVDLAILIMIVAIPMETWAIRNHSPLKPYGGRTLAFHPPAWSRISGGIEALGSWLMPPEIPAALWFGAALSLTCLAVPWIVRRGSLSPGRKRMVPLADVLAMFVIAYVAFALVSLTFFDAAIPLNSRMWMPLMPPLAILYAIGISALWDMTRGYGRLAFSAAFALIVAVPIVINAMGVGAWGRMVHREGQGYLSAAWRNSEMIAAVNALPRSTPIASNAHDAIYVLTGRRAYGLPMAWFRTIRQENPNLRQELATLADQLGSRGVLAYSTRIHRGDFLPNEVRLAKYLRLSKIAEVSDGRLYKIKGAKGAATTQPTQRSEVDR